LVVEDVEIDAANLVAKLAFSKEGENWESTPSADGACVVALDCTQDEAIIAAGTAREVVSHIQRLRKAAGLELKDVVEVFFQEEEGVSLTEDAVSRNVAMLDSKFKGAVPLPQKLAPSWSVALKTESVEVGGSKISLSICRSAVAAKDSLDEAVKNILSTKEPSEFEAGQTFKCSVDGQDYQVKEGVDFWLTSVAKAKATGALSWL
jgi:hypothetical protein